MNKTASRNQSGRRGARNIRIPFAAHEGWCGTSRSILGCRPSFDDERPSRPRLDVGDAPSNVDNYVIGGRYSVGQWIRHARFGLGLVLTCSEGKVMVHFGDQQLRTLAADRTVV
jgi:hypothetical protein